MIEATDELRDKLASQMIDAGWDNGPHLDTATARKWADALLPLVVAVVAEARTEGAIAELEYLSADTAKTLQVWTPSDLNERAAALRGVGNQKVGVTVDDLALDEMDGNQNAEPRWSANRLEEVLREGLPDQQQKANQKGTEQ